MPPNLVILSLDGVSQTLFWQYREAMPFLWDLSNRSAMFRRFYTASTSAFQSFCDFAFGDSGVLDHNFAYPGEPGSMLDRSANLFAVLGERGYQALGVQRSSRRAPYVERNFHGAWPERCGDFQRHGEYGTFYPAIDAFIDQHAGRTPFVLYVSDRAATVGDDCAEKAGARLFHSRFEKGFSLLDRTVRRVVEKLVAAGQLANTIVVAYGSYGTDPWTHGIFRGRTRGLDPHADSCWTPLMIYNNDSDICIADQLVCSIDLKPTIMHMLFPGDPPQEKADPLFGVDILRFRRPTVFTQNMFALEKEGEGPAGGLVKSYGVTDGDQRLVVSSDGGIPGEGGMELYYDPRDPSNTRNFLDFFTLDEGGVMTAFGRPDIVHVHFLKSFRPNLVASIVDSYNIMREQLYQFIRAKEQEALRHCLPGGDKNLFPETSFRRKRVRK